MSTASAKKGNSPYAVIGLDLGGTNIKGAICTREGSLHVAQTTPTKAGKGPELVIRQIHELIQFFLSNRRFSTIIGAIGIGVPGSIDHRRGKVLHPPNLQGWRNVALVKILTEQWKIPVAIENDANAAALGEAFFGAGRGTKNFIGITVGTGIGSGIILDGSIYHGERGFAGELGHTTIDPAGPKCNCGNRGCAEAYVGNSYLIEQTLERLKDRPSSVLHKWVFTKGRQLTPKEISRAANQGDVFAREILVEAGRNLGVALANAANLLDVTTFIIGGGVASAGKPLFEGIGTEVRRRILTPLKRHVRILPAELGNKAGMLGAAALWF